MSGICSASPISDKWCPYAVHGAVPCQSTATSRKTAKCQGRARIFLWGKIEGPRAESRVGFLGRGAAAPSPPAGGLGSTVSSHSWVWGGAPTAQRFSTIFSTQDGLSWHYNSPLLLWTIMQPLGGGGKTPSPSPPCVRRCEAYLLGTSHVAALQSLTNYMSLSHFYLCSADIRFAGIASLIILFARLDSESLGGSVRKPHPSFAAAAAAVKHWSLL